MKRILVILLLLSPLHNFGQKMIYGRHGTILQIIKTDVAKNEYYIRLVDDNGLVVETDYKPYGLASVTTLKFKEKDKVFYSGFNRWETFDWMLSSFPTRNYNDKTYHFGITYISKTLLPDTSANVRKVVDYICDLMYGYNYLNAFYSNDYKSKVKLAMNPKEFDTVLVKLQKLRETLPDEAQIYIVQSSDLIVVNMEPVWRYLDRQNRSN